MLFASHDRPRAMFVAALTLTEVKLNPFVEVTTQPLKPVPEKEPGEPGPLKLFAVTVLLFTERVKMPPGS